MPYKVALHPQSLSSCRAVRINIARGVWGTGRLLREKEVDETPQRALANEEARQLARGKRVVPHTPQPLDKCNGPIFTNVSQLRVFQIRGLMWNEINTKH
ncbi:hypothetical protein GCM10011389_18710 [Pontibacillus salipaludis]|uniref:Uncharacterized protein n=1 Tax=Pontibacillus salipaludis TaxID=1697394 RepID=A0ABQ1Q2I4_9BACI|nr:hypothetical protein GCM10011389_18710 [Pontibacillus salipaludis]